MHTRMYMIYGGICHTCRYYFNKWTYFFRKTSSMGMAHFCIKFLFLFYLNQQKKKILHLFLIIWSSFHLKFKASIHFYTFKPRIISNFWCCTDAFDVIITFLAWCKNHPNFLSNQNKFYFITLMNIKCFFAEVNVCEWDKYIIKFVSTIYWSKYDLVHN